jgi:hypothetical protein
MAGLMVTLFGLAMAFFKYYIDARIGTVEYIGVRIDSLDSKINTLSDSVRTLNDT